MPIEQILPQQRFQVICDYCGQCGPRAEYRESAKSLARAEGFTADSYHNGLALVSRWACPSQDCQEKFAAWKEEDHCLKAPHAGSRTASNGRAPMMKPR